MYPVSWDTETALFGPANMAPPLACVSVKHDEGEALFHWTNAKPFFDELFTNKHYLLVGHNISYDLAVVAAQWPEFLEPIFQLYEEGRVRDTMIRWKLLDIAMGCFRGYYAPPSQKEIEKAKEEEREPRPRWVTIRYNLSESYRRFTKKGLEKDEWRLKYGGLRDLPLEKWPEGARKYPLDDARATHLIYTKQKDVREIVAKRVKRNARDIRDPDPLGDEANQVRFAWWIQLMQCKGIRTDGAKVSKFKEETEAKFAETQEFLYQQSICSKCGRAYLKREDGVYGCVDHGRRGRPWTLMRHNGVRNTKAAKLRMECIMGGKKNCRLTDTGNISVDSEACELSGDILLQEYAALTSLQNVIKKDIPKSLVPGTFRPVHSSFDSLLATGRTSSSKPNIQNVRRLPGIRECFVPRAGNVFVVADYDGLELRTLGQACKKIVGWSKLADILNEGKDPHLQVAAAILKISYEDAEKRYAKEDPEVENARQFAKIANFGFPGGLGFEALILFARRSDKKIEMTVDEARQLKEDWMLAFPEMELYFDHINTKCQQGKYVDGQGLATIQQLFSKRIRGNIRYTVACNSYFQGLGSDATKNAGWLITKACYVDKESPLYGCYIVNYVHDEFILEAPEGRAHEVAMELARLMVLGATPYLPDVPPTVSKPLVSRCWSKKARQVWLMGQENDNSKPAGPNDRLIPWDESYIKKAA